MIRYSTSQRGDLGIAVNLNCLCHWHQQEYASDPDIGSTQSAANFKLK